MSNCQIFNTAIYVRLSKDDGTNKESESIQNQKTFLTQYAINNEFNLVDFYIDDGWSGTNFERPSFQKLLQDIESGKINCIITKDLSRLGRDYIMTGHYIEKYFPKHNVRYIAVNDGIDTFLDNANNDMTPFKSVLNDMYAKDISKKIRTALHTKKQCGVYVGSSPPYGYKIDPNNKGQLIIDEKTAPIVRRIFDMYINGMMKLGIANTLSAEHVATPSQEKNLNIKQNFKGVWSEVMIGTILSNPTYAGHVSQGKYKKLSYKMKTTKKIPPENWIVIKNTHEPIVSQEIFDTAQRISNIRGYSKKEAKPHLLSGLLRCADCGGPMTYTKNAGIVYIVCRTWRSHARLKLCTSHSIREDFVNESVIKALREQAELYINKDSLIADTLKELDNIHTEDNILVRYENRLNEIKGIISSLYMDKVKGIVTEEDFLNMSKQFNEERQKIVESIGQLKQKKKDFQEYQGNTEQIKKLLNEFLSFEKADRNIIVQLIDKIEIEKDKNIKIHFAFKF